MILTGPARGYIKNELNKHDIEFFHINVKSKFELSELYNILDYYFICSEEGGPKGLMEAMSCGTTVIANKVGMVETLIKNKKMYISDFKSDTLLNYFIYHQKLSKKQKNSLSKNAMISAKKFDWNKVCDLYYNKVLIQ